MPVSSVSWIDLFAKVCTMFRELFLDEFKAGVFFIIDITKNVGETVSPLTILELTDVYSACELTCTYRFCHDFSFLLYLLVWVTSTRIAFGKLGSSLGGGYTTTQIDTIWSLVVFDHVKFAFRTAMTIFLHVWWCLMTLRYRVLTSICVRRWVSWIACSAFGLFTKIHSWSSEAIFRTFACIIYVLESHGGSRIRIFNEEQAILFISLAIAASLRELIINLLFILLWHFSAVRTFDGWHHKC